LFFILKYILDSQSNKKGKKELSKPESAASNNRCFLNIGLNLTTDYYNTPPFTEDVICLEKQIFELINNFEANYLSKEIDLNNRNNKLQEISLNNTNFFEILDIDIDSLTMTTINNNNNNYMSVGEIENKLENTNNDMNEYQSLFRGISTMNDNVESIASERSIRPMYGNSDELNTPQPHQQSTSNHFIINNINQNHNDLRDILLQEQLLHDNHNSEENKLNNHQLSYNSENTLVQLNNFDYSQNEKESLESTTPQLIQLETIENELLNGNTIEISTTTTNNQDFDNSNLRNKIKLSRMNSNTNRSHLKRLNSNSGNRRGGVSIITKNNKFTIGKMKLSKKQKAQIEAAAKKEAELARFGNKLVQKYTEEYEVRRRNNNEAVKKCRQKTNETQQEREAKMKILSEENMRLNKKVDTLQKELSVLKGILTKKNNKIPDEIMRLIKEVEQEIEI
jgi:hypothetical protein